MRPAVFAVGADGQYVFHDPSTRVTRTRSAAAFFPAGPPHTVRSATFSDTPDNWFVSYTSLDPASGKVHAHLAYGGAIPRMLRFWLFDNSHADPAQVQVILGPGESFFAQSSDAVIWDGLPERLTEVLSDWYNPLTKWPSARGVKCLALGQGGDFLAVSNGGDILFKTNPAHDLVRQGIQSLLAKNERGERMIDRAASIVLSPADPTLLIIAHDSTYISASLGTLLSGAAVQKLTDVARAHASPDVRSLYDRHGINVHGDWSSASSSNPAQFTPFTQQPRRSFTPSAAASYRKWAHASDALFAAPAPITHFPHPPVEACTCAQPACAELKAADRGGGRACAHDLKALFRAAPEYSLAWLKRERVKWHPDRFGRRCAPAVREELARCAGDVFVVLTELVAEETCLAGG